MKQRQFAAELTAKGCFVLRHGGNHDIWVNPETGIRFPLPRHQSAELSKGLEIQARKALGI